MEALQPDVQILLSQQDESTQSLLEEALEGKDDAFKVKVLNFVVRCGLVPDDPLFLIMIAIGSLEFLLEQAPSALETQFQGWSNTIEERQDEEIKAGIARNQTEITKAVREVVGLTEKQIARRPFRSLLPAAVILLGTFSLGIFFGITVPPWLEGNLDPSGPRRLTIKEARTLDWAMSPQGQYAQKIMEWNAGYLESGQCQKDVEKLGIQLAYGTRKAISGFCPLWIRAPQNRQYRD